MKRLSGIQILLILFAGIVSLTCLARHELPPYGAIWHVPVVEAQTTSSGTSEPPTIAGCPVFPKDNVWNTSVENLPKDPLSETYQKTIGDAKVHPDFGADPLNGIPYVLVPKDTPAIKIPFEYADESDQISYPVPDNAPIESNGAPGTDSHVILIDPERCMLYELYAASHPGPGSWKAAAGAQFDLKSNSLREAGKTSADAAGLPIFPGLVRYDEVASGAIHHALRFTLRKTRAGYVWPARHAASPSKAPELPPMGQRFRLRADFDITPYSETNQVILKALKKYGMILADNGGPLFISGVPDKRWEDDDLHHLSDLKNTDFEAIDESATELLPNSARVNPASRH